jgi:hypothetical protein
MKEYLIVFVILALFMVGLALSLNSGPADIGSRGRTRAMAANASAVLIRLAGYITVLVALQRMIGSPPVPGW